MSNSWVRNYVGIPFRWRGRTREEGVDCWGLVRLVYAERFGAYLPGLEYGPEDELGGMLAALRGEAGPGGTGWTPVGADGLTMGDVLWYMVQGRPHVALWVGDRQALHALPWTNSVVERTDSPTWSARLQGAYRLTGPVRVRGRLVPFGGRAIDASVPAGVTVAEALTAAGIGRGAQTAGLRVFLGGTEIPPDRWDAVKPRAGRLLQVAATPAGGGGGDKSVLRIVATIGIIAASAGLAAPGGLLVGAIGQVGAAVVVGAATIGAGFALNALAPPAKPRVTDASGDQTSFEISGGRNELRPFGRLPKVLGTYRLAPVYLAQPFTESVGDDQYLRCLFGLQGPVELSDIRIGSTPITEFEGVELEVRQGFPTDEPVRLYPGSVLTDDQSVLLRQIDGWTVRRSAVDADELAVELTFPRGLARFESDGDRAALTVDSEVEFSPAGANLWRRVNGSSPTFFRELDFLSRGPEVEFGGVTTHTGPLSWSGDGIAGAKPGYLPASGYAWTVGGWLFAPATGSYSFFLDSSDAADVHIDGREVVTFYGEHNATAGGDPDFAPRSGSITLGAGWHSFRARVECRPGSTRAGGGAIMVGWSTPLTPTRSVLQPSDFATGSDGSGAGSLTVNWFRTGQYDSVLRVTSDQTAALRRSLAWAVPRGQYDVRVRRLSADTADERILDQVFFSALRTVRAEDPVRLSGVAKIALRIRASDQLNGVIDELNVLARSIQPDFDQASNTWISRASSNPASLARAVLQDSAGRPVSDAKIDLAEFQAWHGECVTRGYEYNGVVADQRTVADVLAEIASVGRARVSQRDSRFLPIRDRRLSVPVQHITPRNSAGFRGRKAFSVLPHALRIQFQDRDADYQLVERLVFDDGYNAGNATIFESLQLPGVTSAEQAFRHGRYHLAAARLRPEVYEVTMDAEHLVCTAGDLVFVTHDVPMHGLGFGRVAELRYDQGGNLIAVRLDESVIMEPGEQYRIRVRREDGSSWARELLPVNLPVQTDTLTLSGPVAPGSPMPGVGDLAQFGIIGTETREMVVRSIAMNSDLGAELALVDHAPAVHDAELGPVPPYEPGISRPPAWADGPEDPVIESIRSDDWAMERGNDGVLVPRMLIRLARPSGHRQLPSHAQIRIRPKPVGVLEPSGPWRHDPQTPLDGQEVSVRDVVVGTTYQIRLRVVTPAGRVSRWVDAEHTVVGQVLPPPDVQSFDVARLADGTRRYSWVLGSVPPDVVGVVIRFQPASLAADWAAMSPVHTGVLDAASPQELNDPPAGEWRFAIKMVDVAGNESVNPVFVVRRLGAPRRPGSIITVDARVEGWPGTKTGCFVSNPGPMLEAIDATTWDELASVRGIIEWPAWWAWSLNPTSPIVYEHPAIDLGAVVDAAPEAAIVASGIATAEVRWSDDGATWSAYTPAETVRNVQVRGRFHQWRVTVSASGSGAGRVPVLRELVMDALAREQEQVIQDLDTATVAFPSRVAAGDVRLPIDRTRFRVIRGVTLTFNGSGAGRLYSVVDRSITGPRIQITNPAGAGVDAVVDAIVRGY